MGTIPRLSGMCESEKKADDTPTATKFELPIHSRLDSIRPRSSSSSVNGGIIAADRANNTVPPVSEPRFGTPL